MQGRAADIKDISERLLKVLSGQSADGMEFDSPVVLQPMIWPPVRRCSWIKPRFWHS